MKLKKLLAVALTVAIIICAATMGVFNLTANAATSGTTGDCTWTLDGTVLTISGNGSMANYTYNSSLPWGRSITSVIIEKGVKSIGDYAFYGCTSLTSITIPNSVTSINDAFYNCTSLTSITIPDSVTNIGTFAFFGCESLATVTIGNGVNSIGDSAFMGCSNLENVYITDLAAWCNIDFSFIESNPMCRANNIYLNGEPITSITIPDGTTEIKKFTFYGFKDLLKITIPDSVKTFGYYAFRNCTSLISINIPDSVTSIGNFAFENCTSLTSITIPNSITNIGMNTFYNCINLASITIPDSVISIDSSAFYNCTSLANVYYSGDKIDRAIMMIGDNNTPLRTATWTYNYSEHIYSPSVISPTCTTKGYTIYTCEKCGDVYKDNYVEALDHEFDSLKYETLPTCTEEGRIVCTCTLCSHQKTITVEPYGHDFSLTDTGEYSCTRCGALANDIAVHKFIKKIVKATPTENGYTQYTCADCGYSYKTDETVYITTPKLTVSDAVTAMSKTVTLTVSISDNPGIYSFTLDVDYDKDNLTLTEIKDLKNLNGEVLTSNNRILWRNTALENCCYSGDILKLVFTVSSDAILQDYGITLKYSSGNIIDCNLEDVNLATVQGIITVEDFAIGDIDGNGETDAHDLSNLKQALLDNADINENATCDLNSDGEINILDFICMKRLLAGVNETPEADEESLEKISQLTWGVIEETDYGYLYTFLDFKNNFFGNMGYDKRSIHSDVTFTFDGIIYDVNGCLAAVYPSSEFDIKTCIEYEDEEYLIFYPYTKEFSDTEYIKFQRLNESELKVIENTATEEFSNYTVDKILKLATIEII